MNINELLVKRFHISKEAAGQMLVENRVFINSEKAIQRQEVFKTDALEIDGVVVQEAIEYTYYAYYKPRGIECTLNPNIKDNLLAALPFEEHLYPVGRLDKESEGLLLLTNDGKLYKNIAFAENFKEKEYIVSVDKVLTNEAISFRHCHYGTKNTSSRS
jgi:23S rRNA pseudouridine2604 synthase